MKGILGDVVPVLLVSDILVKRLLLFDKSVAHIWLLYLFIVITFISKISFLMRY